MVPQSAIQMTVYDTVKDLMLSRQPGVELNNPQRLFAGGMPSQLVLERMRGAPAYPANDGMARVQALWQGQRARLLRIRWRLCGRTYRLADGEGTRRSCGTLCEKG